MLFECTQYAHTHGKNVSAIFGFVSFASESLCVSLLLWLMYLRWPMLYIFLHSLQAICTALVRVLLLFAFPCMMFKYMTNMIHEFDCFPRRQKKNVVLLLYMYVITEISRFICFISGFSVAAAVYKMLIAVHSSHMVAN